MPTKPLLKTKKLEKKDVVAQIADIKSFSQINSPNITLANKSCCTVHQKKKIAYNINEMLT